MTTNPLLFVWAAFASSQLLLVLVGWVAWPGPDPEMVSTAWGLAGLGVLSGAASLVVPAMLVTGDGEESVRVRYFVRWAFAESATLLGLVGGFLGGPQWLVVVLAGWALVMLFFAIPRAT